MNEDYKIYMSDLAKRGPKDTMGYQVVCKAITMNIITGEKCFVVWAVQEGYEDLEIIIQKAKDELKNRLVMGCPVIQEVGSDTTEMRTLSK